MNVMINLFDELLQSGPVPPMHEWAEVEKIELGGYIAAGKSPEVYSLQLAHGKITITITKQQLNLIINAAKGK